MTRQPTLTIVDGKPLIVTTVDVADSTETLWLTAEALVALDIGNEAEPPSGADRPRVLEIRSESARVQGDRVRIGPADARRWTILVEPVADAATQVSVRLDQDVDEKADSA